MENRYNLLIQEGVIFFVMADKDNIKQRAVGVDIGTGFISCAEHEEGNKKFRKVRDAFFQIKSFKIF